MKWVYHLRVANLSHLALFTITSILFTLLIITGGDLIQKASTMTLWAEIILPGLASILFVYGLSPDRDSAFPLVYTSGTPIWLTYLERCAYLVIYALIGFVVNFVIAGLKLPEVGGGSVLWVSLLAFPVLMFFCFLGLSAAQISGSVSAGTATAAGVWLAFLLARSLAYRYPGMLFYPFLTFYHHSSTWWQTNRFLLLAVAALLLVTFLLGLHYGLRKRDD